MIMTDTRTGSTARSVTGYLDVTNMCAEIYFRSYSSPSSKDKSVVSIIAISEEKDETLLVSSNGNEPSTWNRLFTTLPIGIYQIAVEGKRSTSGISGLSIDDLAIRHCSKFGEKIDSIW
jgi:hypothetical protein